jgi:hypothetical protein
MKDSISLSQRSLDTLRVGTRVQSFSSSHGGEVAMVDIPSDIIWIKWEPNGAMLPHYRQKLTDVFDVDN